MQPNFTHLQPNSFSIVSIIRNLTTNTITIASPVFTAIQCCSLLQCKSNNNFKEFSVSFDLSGQLTDGGLPICCPKKRQYFLTVSLNVWDIMAMIC